MKFLMLLILNLLASCERHYEECTIVLNDGKVLLDGNCSSSILSNQIHCDNANYLGYQYYACRRPKL